MSMITLPEAKARMAAVNVNVACENFWDQIFYKLSCHSRKSCVGVTTANSWILRSGCHVYFKNLTEILTKAW